MNTKLLVLDNYDSFTYNLVHLIEELGVSDLEVHRNNKIGLEDVARFDRIVLSPGPGIPLEAGIMPELVRHYAPTKKILGVCLGHQCIAEVFGGKLHNLSAPVHGKATPITVIQGEDPLFSGVPPTFEVARYHSWVALKDGFPAELEITAEDEAGQIMALRHRTFKVHGVQFHPESVLTPLGKQLMKNWLEL